MIEGVCILLVPPWSLRPENFMLAPIPQWLQGKKTKNPAKLKDNIICRAKLDPHLEVFINIDSEGIFIASIEI